MSFLDQIGKKISDVGQGVAQSTKNFADVTKLNGMISDEEKKIAVLYGNIVQGLLFPPQGGPRRRGA